MLAWPRSLVNQTFHPSAKCLRDRRSKGGSRPTGGGRGWRPMHPLFIVRILVFRLRYKLCVLNGWIRGPVVSRPKWSISGPWLKKMHFIWVSVYFSTKVLIGDTILTSPTGDGTAILRGHPSHAKVQPFAGQRKYLHFSVILRPWVLLRSRESNPRPPALQSSALPTEIILPR